MRTRNQELLMLTQQEYDDVRFRALQMKSFLEKQIDAKRVRAETEFKNELAVGTLAVAVQDEQNKAFYSYAEKAVSQWKGDGKNIKPLIMELKGYNKRVL